MKRDPARPATAQALANAVLRPTRRQVLGASGGLLLALQLRPAQAVSTRGLQEVIDHWAAGVPVREGRVTLDIAPLVENGNTVPIRVVVDSAMSAADRVSEIVVFNERNPQRDVVRFVLGAACARAEVATRIRLATSQQLVALARLADGSQWSHRVEVVVTLAACIEA